MKNKMTSDFCLLLSLKPAVLPNPTINYHSRGQHLWPLVIQHGLLANPTFIGDFPSYKPAFVQGSSKVFLWFSHGLPVAMPSTPGHADPATGTRSSGPSALDEVAPDPACRDDSWARCQKCLATSQICIYIYMYICVCAWKLMGFLWKLYGTCIPKNRYHGLVKGYIYIYMYMYDGKL